MAGKKDSDDDAAQTEAGGSKKKKMMLIGIVALVLLLGGVGAAGYFMGWFGGGSGDSSAEEATAEGDSAGEKEESDAHGKKDHGKKEGKEAEKGDDGHGVKKSTVPGAPVFFQLPEFLVNLNTGGTQVSFLKMRVAIELASADDVPMVEAQLPRLQDHFNTYLRELRGSDLSGSAGLYRLKEELLLRANQSLAPVKIKDILINEILVQ